VGKRMLFARRYLVAAGCAPYLFTLGVGRQQHRSLIREIARHFGYWPERPGLPQIHLAEVVDNRATLHTSELVAVDGNTSVLEVVTLAALVARQQPLGILEIGTFDGRTTLNLARNAPPDAHVYTIDLPGSAASTTALRVEAADLTYIGKQESGIRFRGTPYEKMITQLYGDSATFDFGFLKAKIDFVFVDGSHSWDYAMADSRTALSLLRGNRGTIVWHDYGEWRGVTEALDYLREHEWAFEGLRHIQGTSLAYAMVEAGAPVQSDISLLRSQAPVGV
jgi:predicted O-methyltransferase YrrM